MMSLEEHIHDIQNKLRNNEYPNEQSISQGIVLRLLSAMRWPVYDTQIVIPEYSLQGKRVDFALCVQKNKPVILIEVKLPGNTLGADKQLFEYAFHKGVPFDIVTDGREWHFYLPAGEGSYDERRVYKLDLIERDTQESAYRLKRYLSFDDVGTGSALENAREDYKNVSKERQARANIPIAWRRLLEEKDEMLTEVISERVESICGYKPTQKQIITYLSSLKPDIESLPKSTRGKQGSFAPPPKSSGRSKIKVTFPDGVEIYQSTVADTMVEVIRNIGFEKVKSIGIEICGFPLVSNQKYKQTKYHWYDAGSGIYVFTNSNTDKKLSQLNEINDALALGLKIEKI